MAVCCGNEVDCSLLGVNDPRALAAVLAVAARDAVDLAVQTGETNAVGAMPAAITTFGLTPREREVLRLLVRRITDREIADELAISPRTVMHHVSRILAKLGVADRRAAAAVEHRLS